MEKTVEILLADYLGNSEILNRIKKLYNYYVKGDDDTDISTKSLKDFLTFIKSYKICTPGIVLTPSGNIFTYWTSSKFLVTIEFLGTDNVCVHINYHLEKKKKRDISIYSINNLENELNKHKVGGLVYGKLKAGTANHKTKMCK